MGTQNSKKEHGTLVSNSCRAARTVIIMGLFLMFVFSKQSPIQPSVDAVPSGDVAISVLSHLIFESDDELQKEEYERRLVKELMVGTLH